MQPKDMRPSSVLLSNNNKVVVFRERSGAQTTIHHPMSSEHKRAAGNWLSYGHTKVVRGSVQMQAEVQVAEEYVIQV